MEFEQGRSSVGVSSTLYMSVCQDRNIVCVIRRGHLVPLCGPPTHVCMARDCIYILQATTAEAGVACVEAWLTGSYVRLINPGAFMRDTRFHHGIQIKF